MLVSVVFTLSYRWLALPVFTPRQIVAQFDAPTAAFRLSTGWERAHRAASDAPSYLFAPGAQVAVDLPTRDSYLLVLVVRPLQNDFRPRVVLYLNGAPLGESPVPAPDTWSVLRWHIPRYLVEQANGRVRIRLEVPEHPAVSAPVYETRVIEVRNYQTDLDAALRNAFGWTAGVPQAYMLFDDNIRPADGWLGWALSVPLVLLCLKTAVDWAAANRSWTQRERLRWSALAGAPGVALGLGATALSVLTPYTVHIPAETLTLMAAAGAAAVIVAMWRAGRRRAKVDDGTCSSNRLLVAAGLSGWAMAGWYLSGADGLGAFGAGVALASFVASVVARLIELRREVPR